MSKVNAKFNLAVTIDDNTSVIKIDVISAQGVELEKMQSLLKVFANVNKSVKRVMEIDDSAPATPAPATEEAPKEAPAQTTGIVTTPIENKEESGEETHDAPEAE